MAAAGIVKLVTGSRDEKKWTPVDQGEGAAGKHLEEGAGAAGATDLHRSYSVNPESSPSCSQRSNHTYKEPTLPMTSQIRE